MEEPWPVRQHQQRLDSAARGGNDRTLRQLLEDVPTERRGSLRWGKALIDVTRRGHARALDVLLGADGVDLAGLWHGGTALHVAAEVNAHSVARKLLAAKGGGPRLVLQAWSDSRAVFDGLVSQRWPPVDTSAKGNEKPRVSRQQLLALAEELGSGEAQLEVEQAFGAVEEGGDEGKGVAFGWFHGFWMRHRPRSSPLSIAAEIGHAEMLGVLLNAVGSSAGGTLHWGHEIARAFHTAAHHQHTELLALFRRALSVGGHQFDLSIADAKGFSALYTAALLGRNVVLSTLLELGADVNEGGAAAAGLSPLHIACARGQVDAVRLLLDRAHAAADIVEPGRGFTPLHTAAEQGQIEVFRLLLGAGADWSATNNEGRIALEVATAAGQRDAVAELIRLESKSSGGCQQGGGGKLRLSAPSVKLRAAATASASFGGGSSSRAAVGNLKTQPPSDDDGHHEEADKKKPPPLFLADGEDRGHEGGGDTDGRAEQADWTVLHAAADANHVESLAVLLSDEATKKEMLEAKWWDDATRSGWTPLMLASMRGHVKSVQALCEAGASIDYQNGNGWDALWVAANDGRDDVVEALIVAGAGPLLRRRDKQGVTPMMAASQCGQLGTVRVLLEYELGTRAAEQERLEGRAEKELSEQGPSSTARAAARAAATSNGGGGAGSDDDAAAWAESDSGEEGEAGGRSSQKEKDKKRRKRAMEKAHRKAEKQRTAELCASYLQEVPLFADLGPVELSRLTKRLTKHSYDPAEVIITEGEVGLDMFIVLEGVAAALKVLNPGEGPTTLKTYKQGNFFGELALLHNQPRAASVYATGRTPTICMRMTRKAFLRATYQGYLQAVPLFKDLGEVELALLVAALEEKTYEPGDAIITEGDEGWSMFVVVDGEAAASKVLNPGDPPTILKTYERGDFFGELALMSNQPRAASVLAVKRTVCMRLARRAFVKATGYEMADMQQQGEEIRGKYKAYLKAVPIFLAMEEYEIEQVIDALEQAQYAKGDPIIKEGEEGDSFYVVIDGTAAASIRGVGVVKEYGPGGFFGELALLTNQPRAASVHATSEGVTRCMRLSRASFNALSGMVDATMLMTLRTVLLSGLLNADTVVTEAALMLGADAGFIDQFGCSPAQHAFEHDGSGGHDSRMAAIRRKTREDGHMVIRQLARTGVDMFEGWTMPGLAVMRVLEQHTVSAELHTRRGAKPEELRRFIWRLMRQVVPALLDGEPTWVKAAVQATLGKSFGWKPPASAAEAAKVAVAFAAGGQAAMDASDGLSAEGFNIEFLRSADAVIGVIGACAARLKKEGKREKRRVRAGKTAYTMTLHYQVLLDTIDLEEAFKRRPGLRRQINSQIDPLQRTPLIIACANGNKRWFEGLLAMGAEAHHADREGKTVLHYAVERKDLAVAKRLLEHAAQCGLDVGSFVRMETKTHGTAYMTAVANLAAAEGEHRAAKWAPEIGENTGPSRLAKIAVRRRRMEQADQLVELLLAHGAEPEHVMRRRRLRRRVCCVCVAMPVATVYSVVGSLTLLVASPSLNEAPFAMPHANTDHRLAFAFSCVFLGGISFLALVLAPLLGNYGGAPQSAQAVMMGVVGTWVLLQLVAAGRALLEPRWARPAQQIRLAQGKASPAADDEQDVGGSATAAAVTGRAARKVVGLSSCARPPFGYHRSRSRKPSHRRRQRKDCLSSLCLLLLLPLIGLQQASLAFVSHVPWRGGWDVMLQVTVLNVDALKVHSAAECADDSPICSVYTSLGNMSCTHDFCPDCGVNAGKCSQLCGFCSADAALEGWFAYAAVIASVLALGTLLALAAIVLSLGVVRKRSLRQLLPPMRADAGFRVPAERLLMPWLLQGARMVIIFNLLRVFQCTSTPHSLATTATTAGEAEASAVVGTTGGDGGIVVTVALLPSEAASGSGAGLDQLEPFTLPAPAAAAVVEAAAAERWVLQALPDTECWHGTHALAGPLALMLLGAWLLTTGVFARSFLCQPRAPYGTIGLHFCERFESLAAVIKLLMAVVAVWFIEHPLVTTASAVLGNGALVVIAGALRHVAPPCPPHHRWVGRVLTACYAGALWASVLALVAQLCCHDAQSRVDVGEIDLAHPDGSLACWYWPQLAVGVGWVALLGVTVQLTVDDVSFGPLLKPPPTDGGGRSRVYNVSTVDEGGDYEVEVELDEDGAEPEAEEPLIVRDTREVVKIGGGSLIRDDDFDVPTIPTSP